MPNSYNDGDLLPKLLAIILKFSSTKIFRLLYDPSLSTIDVERTGQPS